MRWVIAISRQTSTSPGMETSSVSTIPTLERTTNGTGRVEDHTLAELQALDAGYRHGSNGGFSFRDGGSRVPTLEWLLTTFPDVSVVVDLKCDGLAGPLAGLIDEMGARDRLIVGSFHDHRLTEFQVLSQREVPVSSGLLSPDSGSWRPG